jgi:hypothetical protein
MSNLRGYALAGLNLVSFDLVSPNIAATSIPVVGLTPGEGLVGLDFRPVNGLLYALGIDATADTGTLYVLSPQTGVLGVVGTFSGVGDLPPGGYGFDFNPGVDRIRVTTDTGLNFRLNPNTGALAGLDTGIPANDISGAAYTNNRPDNGNITTLYTLDALTNVLNVQNPANAGTQISVGPLGVDFTDANGFDIPLGVDAAAMGAPVTAGSGFALLAASGPISLYSVNLATGAATLVGAFLDGVTPTVGLAIQNSLAGIPTVALSADGASLFRFDTATPATTFTAAVSGVDPGETLVGIDYRPATGQLYGLGVNDATDTGTLYRLDQAGLATAIGAVGSIALVSGGGGAVDLPAGGYGIDFNPTVDRIRITTESGLNFRINPDTGVPVDGDGGTAGINPDGAINGLPAGSTGVSATAYTNSFGQLPGGPTTQYTLDSVSDSLSIQNPPNVGTQTVPHTITLNGVRLDFTSVSGFDIPSSVVVTASGSVAAHFGLAALTVAGVTGLYAVNLTTGAAVDLGAIGTGTAGLAGLALGAPPAVRAGTAGNDSFVAFGGTERIDASAGVDTVTFGFSLTDATVTYAGNEVIVDTATSHTVLTGFEKYVFNDGTVDNNDGDALVDDLFYYAQNHDVWNAHIEADLHYHVVGWTENRDPSAFFDTSLYRQAYPDAAAVDPLVHFDTIGWKEGRMPSLTFGAREYLLANPDVAAAKIDPLAHFLIFGAGEGRQPIAPSKFVGSTGFDYVYYLNANPDVEAAGVDPLLHFLAIGWTEGRDPNALFDTSGYLANYTDVAAANINPFIHYNASGWKEGRDPSLGFDTKSYIAANPDVAAANVNPLMHFLHAGLDEGRSPFPDSVWG